MAGLFDVFLKRIGVKPQNEIRSEIEEFVNAAKEHVENYRKNVEEISKQRKMLELMAHHLGGMVWIKRWEPEQKTYLYEFANRTLCDSFFRFDAHCLEDCTAHVSGRSDLDILNDFRERTKNTHSFGELSITTDIHSTIQAILHYDTQGQSGATSCRYIECGYIGSDPMVIEVVKTPLFDLNYPCKCWASHTYTVGNALDVTMACESRLEYAQKCIEKGEGEKLQNGVYWIYPKKEACSIMEREVRR